VFGCSVVVLSSLYSIRLSGDVRNDVDPNTPSMHTGSLQYGQSGSNFEKAAIDLLSAVINKWEIERE